MAINSAAHSENFHQFSSANRAAPQKAAATMMAPIRIACLVTLMLYLLCAGRGAFQLSVSRADGLNFEPPETRPGPLAFAERPGPNDGSLRCSGVLRA